MLLERINNSQDLKRLSISELKLLATQIREEILKVVAKTGGHLASNLGVVELTLALHYCLDLPQDVIIWDVGHQCYTHKLLSGRRERFHTLRQYQGLSGFPSPQESSYDIFATGHASVACSLGLGLAVAKDFSGYRVGKVVAVIGDGSLTGGICFEALNQIGHLGKDILVILNTNEMSISPNVGALSNYLNKLISLPIYNRFKEALEGFIKKRIPRGSKFLKLVEKLEESIKNLLIPGIFFEELGFRYFGPLDGHNLEILIPTLKNILKLKGPLLLHVVTKKGKGYSPAEKDPSGFHSSPPFDIVTGKHLKTKSFTYTQIFSKKLLELAQRDSRIVAITAAMPEGTGLKLFAEHFPKRFFDVGIAEEHAIAFAAGLAKAGLIPVVAIYSTFLQRAYDQLLEEISLQDLKIILAIDRAGIVGEDGPTHQGIFDLVYLRSIPKFVVMAPKDGKELEQMLEFSLEIPRPVALRYPKEIAPAFSFSSQIQLGKAEVLSKGEDLLIVALGSMVWPCWQVVQELSKEGIKITLVNARFSHPLDEELFLNLALQIKKVLVVEEGISPGGFGSAVLESLFKRKKGLKEYPEFHLLALPHTFIEHGKREILLEKYGLSKDKIIQFIRKNFLCLR